MLNSNGYSGDPFDRDRLPAFLPSPFLTRHYGNLSEENRKKKQGNPEAGLHNLPHFDMMKKVVLDALHHVSSKGTGACTTLVIGAKECNDIPLEALAEQGHVYLIDVDPVSLEVARDRCSRKCVRGRVHTVCMDVSLFETGLIERAQDLLDAKHSNPGRALESVLELHEEVCQRLARASNCCLLPINEERVDLAISSMTLSQFSTGYTNILLNLFLEQYGREQVRAYFIPTSGGAGKVPGARDPVSILQRSTLTLARRATEMHLRELSGMVRKDGIVVLSDHVLHGGGTFASDCRIEVDTQSLVPYSQNTEEDKVLQYRVPGKGPLPASLCVELNRPDETFTVEGKDALKGFLAGLSQLQICGHRNWWWVTERTSRSSDRGRAVWSLVFVDAYTLVKGQGQHA